jgi:carbonic anhydrase
VRAYLVVLLSLAGCKYIDQPTKVAALEKRLDEMADRVGELTGAATDADADGEHEGDDGEAAGGTKSARGTKAKGGRDARSARDARATREARRPRGAKPGRDDDAGDDERAAGPRKPADRRGRARGDDDEGDGGRDRDADGAGGDRGARDRAAGPAAEPAEPIALVPTVDVPWSYDGAGGPAAWGALDPSFAACERGAAQSPIDILPRHSEAPEVIYAYRPAAATVVDTGHGLRLDVDGGGFIVVDGARYDLLQLHVHTPAEHTIAGDSFPLELHLVHRSKAGGVAVVAVLYGEGEPSTGLAPLWKGAPRGRGSARLKKPFDVDAILPRDRAAYRYDGSLTTPPCSEGVIWHVLRRTRSEDERALATIRRRFGATARPIQELGDRTVR